MWPWMRDLPTSVWAGHGWAFDENGLRRLSSSGGSHAMQGVEVFESVGLAAEEVKPSDEKIKEEAPIAVAAAENPPPTCEEQKPARFMKKTWRSKAAFQTSAGTSFVPGKSNFPKLIQKENGAGGQIESFQ